MTTTLDTDLEVFATSVRRELHDLGPDVIDDLTDGLEADLADSLADGGTLGDPGEYAAELRSAAGLDPRGRKKRQASLLQEATRSAIREIRGDVTRFIGRHAVVRGILSFLLAVRPLWWVLRAYGIFVVLTLSNRPQNEWDLPLLAVLTVLSIQWGRGRWLPWRWSRSALVAVGVIAALALTVAIPAVVADTLYRDTTDAYDYISDGILLNGAQVTNIFAYGPDGQPVTDVRLYDQDGNPLSTVSEFQDENVYWTSGTRSGILVPSNKADGAAGWNIYPLNSVAYDETSENGIPASATRFQPPAPFVSVQQLLGYEEPDVTEPTPPVEPPAEN